MTHLSQVCSLHICSPKALRTLVEIISSDLVVKLRCVFAAAVFLLCFSFELQAQRVSVTLSPKHENKLSTIQSGHKRLVKYYKFLKKDSSRQVRQETKRYKHMFDSMYRANRKRIAQDEKRHGVGLQLPETLTQDSLNTQLKYGMLILNDTSASDSTKNIALEKVKAILLEKMRQNPGFQHLLEQYQLDGDTASWQTLNSQVPGIDSLKALFGGSPSKFFMLAEKETEKRLGKELGGQFAEANALKELPGQFKHRYEGYLNKDSLRNSGMEILKQQAAGHFAGHAENLRAAQNKVSKLLSKYKEFANADDLSTAVKRTSMQGKTFWEHLLVGGNLNVVSMNPFSLDFSPQLGYKFTTQFSAGFGLNYRYTYSDSIKYRYYVSASNTSFKAFVTYDIIKGIYAYAEWEKSGIKANSNDKSRSVWKDNYFVGIGKKFLVHPKVYVTITALYNLNDEANNPVYPRRFQVRLGFQLSELATRKKKVYYDRGR